MTDLSVAATSTSAREKAGDAANEVGAAMPGVVVDVKVKVGDAVSEGELLATLSAMKMESGIPATKSGVVERVLVSVGDKVEGKDLLFTIGEAEEGAQKKKKKRRARLNARDPDEVSDPTK